MGEEREDSEGAARPVGFQDPHQFTLIAVAFELFLIPSAWFLAWIWRGESIPSATWEKDTLPIALLLTLPLIAVLALTVWTPLRKLPPLKRMHAVVRRILGKALVRLQVWQVLAVAIAAGVGEEVLFRGALQPRLGPIFSNVVFGVLHWLTPTYAIFAFLMGSYLSWAYERWPNLAIPILVHALYDAAALLVLRHQLRREADLEGGSVDDKSPDSA
jgi:hypothetical protein